MKKIISFIFILFLVGCSKNNYITCNIEIDNNTDNYNMTGKYIIYYKDNYVTKIEKDEKYITNDQSILNYLYESKNLEYYNLNDLYNGYDYIIEKNDMGFKLNTIIDVNNVNIKYMIKNGYLDKDYAISNRLTTSGIVKFYESKGAICDI